MEDDIPDQGMSDGWPCLHVGPPTPRDDISYPSKVVSEEGRTLFVDVILLVYFSLGSGAHRTTEGESTAWTSLGPFPSKILGLSEKIMKKTETNLVTISFSLAN